MRCFVLPRSAGPERVATEAATDIRRKLDGFSEQIDEMIGIVQKLAADLRPDILDLGIGAAIKWLTHEFSVSFRD